MVSVARRNQVIKHLEELQKQANDAFTRRLPSMSDMERVNRARVYHDFEILTKYMTEKAAAEFLIPAPKSYEREMFDGEHPATPFNKWKSRVHAALDDNECANIVAEATAYVNQIIAWHNA